MVSLRNFCCSPFCCSFLFPDTVAIVMGVAVDEMTLRFSTLLLHSPQTRKKLNFRRIMVITIVHVRSSPFSQHYSCHIECLLVSYIWHQMLPIWMAIPMSIKDKVVVDIFHLGRVELLRDQLIDEGVPIHPCRSSPITATVYFPYERTLVKGGKINHSVWIIFKKRQNVLYMLLHLLVIQTKRERGVHVVACRPLSYLYKQSLALRILKLVCNRIWGRPSHLNKLKQPSEFKYRESRFSHETTVGVSNGTYFGKMFRRIIHSPAEPINNF
mmetsp:Transcript_2144/g.4843  ORF Transcript_2144/g.4843 Transcript_2144/m.4843 type:complete len:270 (+) Transcript_2144:364-1173(+)